MANKRTNEYDNERKTKQFRTLAAWLIRFDRFLRSRSSVLRTHESLQGRANWNSNSALLMGSEGGVGNRTHSMNPYYGFHRYTIEIHCILYIVRTFYSLYLTFALFVECAKGTTSEEKEDEHFLRNLNKQTNYERWFSWRFIWSNNMATFNSDHIQSQGCVPHIVWRKCGDWNLRLSPQFRTSRLQLTSRATLNRPITKHSVLWRALLYIMPCVEQYAADIENHNLW